MTTDKSFYFSGPQLLQLKNERTLGFGFVCILIKYVMLLVCKYAFSICRPLLIFFTHHIEVRAPWISAGKWSRDEGKDNTGEGVLCGLRKVVHYELKSVINPTLHIGPPKLDHASSSQSV